MRTSPSYLCSLPLVGVAASALVSCTAAPTQTAGQPGVVDLGHGAVIAQLGASSDLFKGPALIAVDGNTGGLIAYPMRPGGDNQPRPISKSRLFGYGGLAGNGHLVIGTTQFPPAIVEYDVDTHATSTMKDPYGTPVDMAIGKDGSLYVINYPKGPTNVTWYPKGKPEPKKLECGVQDLMSSVAVDDEGDIFTNGFDKTHPTGVAEIPNGPNGPEPAKCKLLQLQPEQSPAGVAIDPKNDALLTLENPGQCAGGEEGRLTIYPKPYKADNYRFADVGQNCSGGISLNRDANIVFVGDEDVSGSYYFIIQSSFPDGRFMGEYHGSQPTGITTIPNELPN